MLKAFFVKLKLLAKILYEAADQGINVNKHHVLNILELSEEDVAHVVTGTAPTPLPQAPSTAPAVELQATPAAPTSNAGTSNKAYLGLVNTVRFFLIGTAICFACNGLHRSW